MRRLLLCVLFLPVFSRAQEVKPILSKDYLDLINRDSLPWNKHIVTDTISNSRRPLFKKSGFYDGHYRVGKIVMRRDGVFLKPAYARKLMIGGSFTSTAAIKSVNQMPALQPDYVQGRSQSGALQWRGPETGELFSYGPAVRDLEFDNSSYAYDANGRLVPAGSGSGKQARSYDNSIIRTGSLFEQALALKGRYLVNGNRVLTASVRLGKGIENMVIRDNRNKTENVSVSLEALVKRLLVTGSYTAVQDRFSNNNRNGFLNRTYQQSLLTPVSFDNDQGYILGNGQRSYSAAADNPWFLLKDNGNSCLQSHQTGSLGLEKKYGRFRFKLLQSAEFLRQNGQETYKPGTAWFPDGKAVSRKKNDANHLLNAEASYWHHYYPFEGTAGINYFYGNNKTDIRYQPGGQFHYQRSSHDLSIYYQLKNDNGSVVGYGVNLTNKIYASNTGARDHFFLPGISGYVSIDELFDIDYLRIKAVGNFNRFVSELPVNKSFSSFSLLQYSTDEALQYFPVTEIAGFEGLNPVRHDEWTTRLEVDYRGMVSFQAEVFMRNNKDDIFPVLSNGEMQLVNMADHRNTGVELTLNLGPGLWKTKKLSITNNFSFFKYNNIVRQVRDGYQYTPIAGFRNVHKAIVQGEALGAIVGNSYLRDANNNIIIGNDGFPLVNANPSVIGNPIPDFVLKMSNGFNWKNFTANIDLEWKKGGDVWNGTQAVLDYYGRSAGSGALRNTTAYIFPGVLANGHVNDIPVKFYDPSLPLENNRWVRYGHTGVAEAYIQRGDYLRLNNISLGYKMKFRKYLQFITLTAYAGNILLWTPYKGADPNQLLYDQPHTEGLDFFNLPSVKTLGLTVSVQF